MAKFKSLLKKTWEWAKPYVTWKIAPFLIIAWMITNGWSYVFVTLCPSAFASNKPERKFYIPTGTYEAYSTATNWATYAFSNGGGECIMTIEEMQQQILELQKQMALLNGGYVPPEFSIRHYVADEGKVFRRYDGMMMGKELYLGYDYSLGFKRMDYIEFYEQIDDPNTVEDGEE